MPSSLHDFALKDLAFSNSEAFFLASNQKGYDSSRYLFFPGCQLGASEPEIVERVYDDLAGRLSGGVGILLGCCGVIAKWAGKLEEFTLTMDKVRKAWEELGRPQVITACPTCYQILGENQPEMEIQGIWTILESLGLPEIEVKSSKDILAIHDTCTTRYNQDIQDSIRRIVLNRGYLIEELPYSRAMTKCCGYGGLMSFANHEVGEMVVESIIDESCADYLTYCVNCRDRFAAHGKRAFHLLELFYQDNLIHSMVRKPPNFSERHENRIKLKKSFCFKIGKEYDHPIDKLMLRLSVSDSVLALMEDRMILTSDISKVISNAEKTNNKLLDEITNEFIAYHKLAYVTYWIRYTIEGDQYILHNAYSHRMEITDESGGQVRYSANEEDNTNISCVKCGEKLRIDKVTLTYMGNKFPVELPKCLGCGMIFIPEALVLGKMLQVEKALEDK
jgi:glutamate synthase (NADPH/NADH) small chain